MQVWTIIFQRLQAAKTSRFVRGFLVFLSHYVVKRGPAALQASTDTVQPGIFLVILQQACPRLSIRAHSRSHAPCGAYTRPICITLPAGVVPCPFNMYCRASIQTLRLHQHLGDPCICVFYILPFPG